MNGEVKVAPRCYACDGPAHDWPWPGGLAQLGYGCAVLNETELVPICEACFGSRHVSDAIARRFYGMPDLKITEGGEASPEAVREIADALKAKEGGHVH
jgi:hypothetical protein